MNQYNIRHDWKHVQGHIATSKWKNVINANNEEEAIIKYKERNIEGIGKYIHKDTENDYYFYGTKSMFANKEDNVVYAVLLN